MEKVGVSGENYKFNNKWEIFESDCSIPGYGVCSWARRNFTCNFCKKEYKSAQALGGHMNVHRRDRARLRLSSLSTLDFPNPNPNPNPILPPPLSPSLPPRSAGAHGSSPLISTPSLQEEDKRSGFGFGVGENSTRKKMKNTCGQENECRVWMKRDENSEMVLLRDAKNIGCLDLELRLGRS